MHKPAFQHVFVCMSERERAVAYASDEQKKDDVAEAGREGERWDFWKVCEGWAGRLRR